MKTVFTAQHSIDPRQSSAYVDKNHDGDITRKDFNATRELGYDATDDEFDDLLRCFARSSRSCARTSCTACCTRPRRRAASTRSSRSSTPTRTAVARSTAPSLTRP